jgi:hypothetical protein
MTAWKSAHSLAGGQHNRRGLHASLEAGRLCLEAERRHPGLFHAVSVRNGVMHLEVSPASIMKFKLVEGKLLKDLIAFATPHNLPVVTRFRLTITSS